LFNAGDGQPSYGFDPFGKSVENIDGHNSTVCLSVNSGSLAQKGDDFTDLRKFEQGITMEVDDLSPKFVFAMPANLELINVGDIDGNIFIRGIGPKII
jgi:hypothetical protein